MKHNGNTLNGVIDNLRDLDNNIGVAETLIPININWSVLTNMTLRLTVCKVISMLLINILYPLQTLVNELKTELARTKK